MADAVAEQRLVTVFNSDDDLTNFLAGLRAKYASLYPQVVESQYDEIGIRTSSGGNSAIVSGATAASDACIRLPAVDELSLGSINHSFEQKMSQLRSSLQSLQHILPPRTSTTTNLLDSFIAVSGDHKCAHSASNVGSVAVALMQPACRDDGSPDCAHGPGPAATPQDAVHVETCTFMPSDAISSDVGPLSRAPVPVMGRQLGADARQEDEATALRQPSLAPEQPSEHRKVHPTALSEDRGASEGDAAPSDVAFVELAAGYSQRTLHPPSSEVSTASLEGHHGAALVTQVSSGYSQNAGYGYGGSELTFGGALPATAAGDSQQGGKAGEGGRVWLPPGPGPQRAARDLELEASVLGPPTFAAITFSSLDDSHHVQQSSADTDVELLAQQPPQAAATSFGREGGYVGPQRGNLNYSPGRRRAWQLVGLGSAMIEGVSSQLLATSCDQLHAAHSLCDHATATCVPLGTTRESSVGWESLDEGASASIGVKVDDEGFGQRNTHAPASIDVWQALGAPSTLSDDGRDLGIVLTHGFTGGLGGAAGRVAAPSTQIAVQQADQVAGGSCQKDGLQWPQLCSPKRSGVGPLLQSACQDRQLPGSLGPLLQVQQGSLDVRQRTVWQLEEDIDRSAADPEPLLSKCYGSYVGSQQQPPEQHHATTCMAPQGEGAQPWCGNEKEASKSPSATSGGQRQRRRWGSPAILDLQLGFPEGSPLGLSTVVIGVDAAGSQPSSERSSRARWRLNEGSERASSLRGSPGDIGWDAPGAYASSSLPEMELNRHPSSVAVALEGTAVASDVPGEGGRQQAQPELAIGKLVDSGPCGGVDGDAATGETSAKTTEQGDARSRQQHQRLSSDPLRPLRRLSPPQLALAAISAASDCSSVVPVQVVAVEMATSNVQRPPREQVAMDAWLQSDLQGEKRGPMDTVSDDVLCGSPTALPHQLQPLAELWCEGSVATDCAATVVPVPVAQRPLRTQTETPHEDVRQSLVEGFTANMGGIAFSISVDGGGQSEGDALRGSRNVLPAVCASTTVAASITVEPPVSQSQSRSLLAGIPPAAPLGSVSPLGPINWERLNRQLREAGFSGLLMSHTQAALDAVEGNAASGLQPAPDLASLHRCLSSVLDQYVRRNRLVAELLSATEQSGRIAEQQEATIRELKREMSATRTAADKAWRELSDMSSQQLPKVEARHAAQLGRLRSEAAKLKEALRVSELELTAKMEEIRSLRATITGLQSAGSHSSDVEGAALRQRVAQLEALMRTRDKELEKLKASKDALLGQAEDGQANALDRAYEAETTAKRLDMELAASRTRITQLEQGLRQRERDVVSMREDLQQIKACGAAATVVAQDRSAAAEEMARRVENEATLLRGKVKELEAVVRAAKQELEKQRSDTEALRSSAYDELYRLEDACRTLGGDLAAARTRITQLEHVVRAKDRDITRVRDERDGAKAAERERARVAEEVSVKLDAELTAAKIRLTQAEGAVRTRERELGRLAELLRQTQGAEAEAWLNQAKLEAGSRKMDNDFTSLRLRVLQLEATLKGRDRECDKLARTVEMLRAESHELTSKLVKSEEAGCKTEADLVASRGRVLSLEGQVRVKERQQERLVRMLAELKAGDSELASRQTALEEVARRLDGQLKVARSRVIALEGVVRARDAAVERLNRQLEALKTAEFERLAQALKCEEAGRLQDTEAAAMRQRLIHLEGQLRAKDRELECSARQIDAARAAEADAGRRLADATVASGRLEAEVAAGRQRAAQLGEALRGRERELVSLGRALEVQRAAEHEANVVAGRTEMTARKLDGEATEFRQQLVQVEGQLRMREREVERQVRALEAAQTAAAEATRKQSDAEAMARRLEADAAGLRARLAQAEGTVRAREKDLERMEKAADKVKGAEATAEAKLRSTEATVAQLEGELASLRLHISQLEVAARGHSKEVDRLTRVADQSKAAQADAAARAQRSNELTRQVEAELASARIRLSKVEASLLARERDAQRLQRLLEAAEAQATTQVVRSDDFVRRVEVDLANMRQQATQLAQLIRARDRQLSSLRGVMEAAQAAEAKAVEQLRQNEEALRKVEADLTVERQRNVQLDGQVKSRDREVERLGRQLDAGREQSNTVVAAAGRDASSLKDAAARADAALSTARARVTQLESELVAKQRELEGLQRLVGSSRAGDAEAAATAEERARRAEEVTRRLDSELGAVRQRFAHLEHIHRSREATMDKLRAALAEKVAQEERRVARDKAAYQRIRAAYVATMAPHAGGANTGTLGGGAVKQQRAAAGAMAAAARELRPVELVGLYESRREAAEQELAGYRAEARNLADQLREAQNHIAIKDRTGAWRTPTELADMQAHIIKLERRSADLQRELDRARLDAAETARAAERRLAEVEHRTAQLKEDNDALVHELENRPKLQDNRVLKREVEILEKRLLMLKGSSAVSGAGADAEGGETALSLAAAGKGPHAGAMLTTSQRIARDRSLHHLGLRSLEDWPKGVLVDLVQDVCIELDVRDATTLPAAVRKTLRVVGAVPRMEGFIGAVCERVYLKGAAFVPRHIDGTTDPSRALEVLDIWLGLLQEGVQLRGAMRAVVEALAERAEGMAAPIHGPGDVVVNVRQLVQAEAVALTARESLAAAAQHMASEPEQLLSRLVSHFMRLFDCPSLDGVIPAVNRLYVTLNEQRNFTRSLAAALDLSADAGSSACMARIHELVKFLDVRVRLTVQQNGTDDSACIKEMPRHANEIWEPHITPPDTSVEASAALERLLHLFGVRTAKAAVDSAEKSVTRLKRLDDVLPRYQRMASQLFEVLRVTSLDEIVPAVQAALKV